MANSERLLIGWREWVSLPNLNLPMIKAKLDTGARTSALHAVALETFWERGRLKVRFQVHPLRTNKKIIILCEETVVDHRWVSDSGGHRERRYVIETPLQIGGLYFPIEVTLTNRESMSHRMLIGRSAMNPLLIDPNHEFLLGKPSHIKQMYNMQALHRNTSDSASESRTKKKAKRRKL